MKITDIKKQAKREDRFSVFVDQKYSFSLDQSGLIENKVKIGVEVSEFDIEKLQKASEDSLLLIKAYDKCMRRLHSEREIVDYLRKHKASDEVTEMIITKCKLNKLLDDQQFAEGWAQMRRNQGRSNRRITQELMQKGVNKEIVDSLTHDPEENKSALRKIIEKKRRTYPDDKKLIAYLQRQGFGYYDIAAELEEQKD